jgi:hypothetical protein
LSPSPQPTKFRNQFIQCVPIFHFTTQHISLCESHPRCSRHPPSLSYFATPHHCLRRTTQANPTASGCSEQPVAIPVRQHHTLLFTTTPCTANNVVPSRDRERQGAHPGTTRRGASLDVCSSSLPTILWLLLCGASLCKGCRLWSLRLFVVHF